MSGRRLGILISGRGSNMLAIADRIADGRLDASIAVVISNRADAAGVVAAHERDIPVRVMPSKDVPREEYDQALAQELKSYQVDLVCLAGFLRLLTPGFIEEFRGRILNIHPSLLPAFPGLDAQKQALQHGVRYSGCTTHFVNEHLDAGPIIGQAVVPVLDDDTESSLADRILREEHELYSRSIELVLSGAYRVDGRRIVKTN